jgi:hypothetical protein
VIYCTDLTLNNPKPLLKLFCTPLLCCLSGASEKMLRQLKVTWYQNKVDPEDPEPDTCPICFCEYNPGAALIKLDCGHFFHKECIRKWLKRDATCPMCKTGLTGSAHRRLQQQLQQQGVAEPDTPEALNVTAVQPGELDGSLAAAAAEQQELAPTAAAPGVQGQQPADLQPPAVHAASAAQLPLSTGVGQQQQS